MLIAEHEESFSDALSYQLRRQGFEVPVCATGPAALDAFDQHGADLALLDPMLPGLAGTEVCQSLRERSDVPVIMLSARDTEIDKAIGLALSPSHVQHKVQHLSAAASMPGIASKGCLRPATSRYDLQISSPRTAISALYKRG